MSLAPIFQALESLEEAMARLYERYAESFADDTETAALFARLALEEHGHARQVSLQRRLTQKLAERVVSLPVGQAEIARMIAETGDAAARASTTTLAEALALAAGLEATAAERHLGRALSMVDPEIARLVAGLGRGDNDHLERVRAFAASRGITLS